MLRAAEFPWRCIKSSWVKYGWREHIDSKIPADDSDWDISVKNGSMIELDIARCAIISSKRGFLKD